MAALDYVDGVDLHVTQVLHRGAGRFWPVAEGRVFVELLGAQPDAPGVGCGYPDRHFAPHDPAF